MSHAFWFDAPLTCLACGTESTGRASQLSTSGLNPEAIDAWVALGDAIEIDSGDFEDGYFALRDPGSDNELAALEQWSCPVCRSLQWARIGFRREAEGLYRVVSVRTVPLTVENVRQMHFVSRRMDLWVEANPGAETEALLDVMGDALRAPKRPS